MLDLRGPYISRVKINNYRNFTNIDVLLSHKQIIIGENNVGKTNFIRAIQIILDPKLSDEDRYLNESDFSDNLIDPMLNDKTIEIIIEVSGFDHNKNLLSIIGDASINDDKSTIRLTYKYYPVKDATGKKEYQYTIFQGNRPEKEFTHIHRKYLNLKVINALRDVENEMKNIRRSPINQLLKDYQINKSDLEKIAINLKDKSKDLLDLGEIKDLERNINNRFFKVLGTDLDKKIALETIDIDPNRILNTLKLMIGDKKQRPTSETSLGINNILFISLILLSLEDKTIPTFLNDEKFEELNKNDQIKILEKTFKKVGNNYLLKDSLSDQYLYELYQFMEKHNPISNGFTILAIEEPEAHLHPTYQRIIYKDVMKNNTSVLLTTHSPFITSVAPLDSIVHLRHTSNGSKICTTADFELPSEEMADLARFIDVKKGELYFGKGIILVEGISEEYLVPKFADLLNKSLDIKGIFTCNINSTNFTPYVKFLDKLEIPYVVITDGDYYFIENKKRVYRKIQDDNHNEIGYLGNELTQKLLIELGKIGIEDIPSDFDKQDTLFKEFNFYLGHYTLEVDMMSQLDITKGQDIIINIFNDLTDGGDQHKENFQSELESGDYASCLRKIDKHIGKGRFAQRLSILGNKDHIPNYVKEAIESIYEKVNN